jgi:hypothetical protein
VQHVLDAGLAVHTGTEGWGRDGIDQTALISSDVYASEAHY